MRVLRTSSVFPSLLALAFAAAACTGANGGGAADPLTGDISGAVGLALMKPSVEEAFAFVGAAADDTSAQPFFTLVKIDANGNLDPCSTSSAPSTGSK